MYRIVGFTMLFHINYSTSTSSSDQQTSTSHRRGQSVSLEALGSPTALEFGSDQVHSPLHVQEDEDALGAGPEPSLKRMLC